MDTRVSITSASTPQGGIQMVQAASSDWPSAALLKEYNEIMPDSAKTIFEMAQSQIQHRQQMEREEIVIRKETIAQEGVITILGQISSFILVLFTISAGCYLILHDKSTEGLAALISGLAIIIGAIVYQKKQQK